MKINGRINIKEHIKQLFMIINWLLKVEFTMNKWRDNDNNDEQYNSSETSSLYHIITMSKWRTYDKSNSFNTNDLHNECEYHHTSMAAIFYNRISYGIMCIYAIIYKMILQYLFILFMDHFRDEILQMFTQILHLGRRSISNYVLFACAYNGQTKTLMNVYILYYIGLMIDYNVFNLCVDRFFICLLC